MYTIDREIYTTQMDGEKWATLREANRLIRAGSMAILERTLRKIGVEMRPDAKGEWAIRLEDVHDMVEAKKGMKGTQRWARAAAFEAGYRYIKEAKMRRAFKMKSMSVDEMIAEQKRRSIARIRAEAEEFFAHMGRQENQARVDRALRTYDEPATQRNDLKTKY